MLTKITPLIKKGIDPRTISPLFYRDLYQIRRKHNFEIKKIRTLVRIQKNGEY